MKKIISVILAVALCFALAVSALAGTYTAPAAKAITVDGAITEEEWGAPIFKGVSKAAAMDGSVDGLMNYWEFDPAYTGTENFDLYVNNDSQNIYLGLVMHDTAIDAASMGTNLWQFQNFTFTISTSMGAGVPAIDFEGQNYEQYTGFRIGMKADGSSMCEVLTQGIDAVMLTDSQYKIVYDEANKTMVYEVAVPYGLTNIDLANSTSMALSAVIPLQYASNSVDAGVNGANRFLIGTAAAFCGGAGNYAHNDQTVIVTLNGADAVAGITGTVEETPAEEPEAEPEAAPEEEAETGTTGQTTTVTEVVERDLVWKATTQVIIIIVSGVVVLASAVVILLSLKKKKVTEEAEEAQAPSEE